jgi:YhgE/Pip-like protein
MSLSQPRHAAPNPNRNIETIKTVRFWAAPVLITLALMSALCALYLGGILNPKTNLRHFPIAVVNEDAGPAGAQIADGLVAGLDKQKFDVRKLSKAEATRLLDHAQVYAAVVIPPTFSSSLREYGASAITPVQSSRPVITIWTNPRAGTLGASIAHQTLDMAMAVVEGQVGQQLTAEVAARAGETPLTGASAVGLASPIDINSTVYHPLPNGTGNGLSAFYYSLLLLLAGFTGSIVVSALVDALLGYVPAEFGPVYRFAEQVRISRLQTLLVKWGIMVLLALLTSAAYLAIADWLGMPIELGWQLWAYGALAIAAVGITSTSLLSALGSIGLLVSLLVFVFFGLPSAGATVPLEAVPPLFRWLAEFEPMHQVFLGTRALLYLGGATDAGLSQALWMTSLGLVIGLLLGGIVTHVYDRKGFHRIHGAAELAIAAEHQAQHLAHLRAQEGKQAGAPSGPPDNEDNEGNEGNESDKAGESPSAET